MSGNVTTIRGCEADEELPGEEAARLLGVAQDALDHWSRELDFPVNVGSDVAPRFRREEVETLRTTLASAHSVEGAIREARRRLDR